MRIFIDCYIDDLATLVDEEVGEIRSAAAERNPCWRTTAGKDLAFLIRCELVAAAYIDQSTLVVENGNQVHSVVQKLKNLLAGRTCARPHEVCIHKSRHFDTEVIVNQQSAPDIAVRYTADNARLTVLNE